MANKFKKLFVVGSIASTLFMALTACDFNRPQQSNNENSTSQTSENSSESSSTPAVELTNITVVNNKNSYERNEQLDLVVTATYSDGTTAVITDYQIEGFDPTVTGNQNITVSYQGKTSPLSVLVNEPVLVDISVSSKKENYEYGDELDIVVTANYSDGSSNVVTDYQVSGFNGQLPGDQNILVTYEGKTSSLQVKVNDPIIVSLNVTGLKETYEYGEDLELEVSATYSDGNTVNVTDYEVTGFDSSNPGDQTIVVSYENKTFTQQIKINNPALTSISVVNNKETYEYNDELDIVVTASYADGSSKEVSDYEVSGFDSKISGEQDVTVTFGEETYSFKVNVNKPGVTGLTAVSNKESYNYGDRLNLTVVATYADGSKVNVTDYEVTGFNSKESGTQVITVTFEGKTCELTVLVNEMILTFPNDKMNTFLTNENITTEIPAPAGFTTWTDSVNKEQDGSNYFLATTEDNGQVGSDSLADQYALILEDAGWTVINDNNVFNAKKDGGNAELVFKTENNEFSLRVYSYVEFPDSKFVANRVKGIVDISSGGQFLIGSSEKEFVVNGFDTNSLKTSSCYFDDAKINKIERDSWRFSINKLESGKYSITDINGRKLGARGVGKLAWDQGTTEWSIVILKSTMTITNANKSYGKLTYNPDTGLVTTAEKNNVELQLFKISNEQIIYPTSISLGGKDEIGTERTTKLKVNYVPENANSINDIIWSSSDENIAKVDKRGVVTGISEGEAIITARTRSKNNNLETSFVVEIVEQPLDSWTIMVYMCGSNLESGSGRFATSDIREMLSVKNQPDDVNIIIETGGSRSWGYPGIDAGALCRYHIENNQLVLDEKAPKAGMGEQSTVEDFLNWGLENYPAYKTGVVFWDHGGALQGCCNDEIYGGELLNSETSAAFANVFEERGLTKKLEFVGYDCCLMQVQDIAEFNSHYFNYMLGSEEVEDGYGWDYDGWVDDLYAGADTETILKAACNSFVISVGINSDQTLSYLKLNKMADYYNKLETLSADMRSTVKSNWYAFRNDYYSAYQYYGFSSYGSLDGYDFLSNLKEDSVFADYADRIQEVMDAYKSMVGYEMHGGQASGSNGLAFIASSSSYTYPARETNFNNWRSLFF